MNPNVERGAAVALAVATLVGVVTGLELYRKSLALGDGSRAARPRPVVPSLPPPPPALLLEHETSPLRGPNPFLLASELETGKDYRAPPPPPPALVEPAFVEPELVLQGLIILSGGAKVIVNGEVVAEGEGFLASGTRVTLVAVLSDGARFAVGEHVFERALLPR